MNKHTVLITQGPGGKILSRIVINSDKGADAVALTAARTNHKTHPRDHLTAYFDVFTRQNGGTSTRQRYTYNPDTDTVKVS